MAASQSNGKIFGRFDPIHIALAVTSVIFLILSIVFIILFATKHDTSTGFLATGFSDSKSDDVSSELRGLLNNKYTVNSFALDLKNKAVSAVFSLRDSVSTDDVKNVLSGSKLVTQLETTYGDKATEVCRQQQVFVSSSPAPTSSAAPMTTQTTAVPVVATRYCKSNPITRDIVIVIDMNDNPKNNRTEKMESLTTIRDKLINGITFPQANVFLKAVVGDYVKDISTKWIDNANQLNTDFANILGMTTFINATSLIFADILTNSTATLNTGRPYVPGAIFVITDKPVRGAQNNPKDTGIYVGVSGVGPNYIKYYVADKLIPYDHWKDLASADPFQTLVCSFYERTAAQIKSYYNYPLAELDDQTNNQKCEVLDIIIAFDISESLSRLIVPKYVTFAKNFVAQYKYKGNDFTRVGILTFNDNVNEILTLTAGNDLNVVNTALDKVEYAGGLTDVTNALTTARTIFQKETDQFHSKVLIVLSDAVPTVDSYQDEIKAGKDLSNIGVATFFVGYSSYDEAVTKELGQVTNPNFVFGDMSDASFTGMTNQILITYPCPQPKCVTSYFAIEISEATDDYVVQNLKDILTIANTASTMQTETASYQLVTYNDVHNTQINPKGDASFASFKTYVQSLIDDPNKVAALRSGHTRLDMAIDDVAAEMAQQSTKNARFSGNIIFFGQANDAVLDPKGDKITLLKNAAANLRTQTAGLIFVVDDSRAANNFGADLWSSVTSDNRIIQKSDNTEESLKGTDYFTTWSKLSCSLPALTTCYDTPLDVAVIIDLQKQDYDFINYITKLISRFSSQDDTHFSMLAYGSKKTSVLSNLAAHSSQDVQDMAVVYEDWRNGTYFITTTTQAPTSSTTEKPKNFWTNDLYQVDQKTMAGVFDAIGTQFGCGHYSDDGDRVFAPNLFIFASDNFGSYPAAVWNDFQTEVHNRYGCWDCAATPSFLFLSRGDVKAPIEVGPTINLFTSDLDIDETDDTSTQANINKFNDLVNTVCVAQLPTCATYVSTCTFS